MRCWRAFAAYPTLIAVPPTKSSDTTTTGCRREAARRRRPRHLRVVRRAQCRSIRAGFPRRLRALRPPGRQRCHTGRIVCRGARQEGRGRRSLDGRVPCRARRVGVPDGCAADGAFPARLRALRQGHSSGRGEFRRSVLLCAGHDPGCAAFLPRQRLQPNRCRQCDGRARLRAPGRGGATGAEGAPTCPRLVRFLPFLCASVSLWPCFASSLPVLIEHGDGFARPCFARAHAVASLS